MNEKLGGFLFHISCHAVSLQRQMDLVGKMTLSELQIGQSAEILHVGGSGALRQHILDMGMIPGTVVKGVKYAPMGDPWI